jgi:hypothetical protein
VLLDRLICTPAQLGLEAHEDEDADSRRLKD